METLWCGQNYITAILIPIQQNNSFTHFLSYSSFMFVKWRGGVRHAGTQRLPPRLHAEPLRLLCSAAAAPCRIKKVTRLEK